MKIWTPAAVSLAIAAAFPLNAAAQSNEDLLKELKALRERVGQLEDKLKAIPAPPASGQWGGMTPDQQRDLGNVRLRVDTLEEQRDTAALKGLKISGSIDPTYIYNRARDSSGFQFLSPYQRDSYTYDNSTFGAAYLDFQKEMEGGTRFRITLAPDRGIGSTINFGSIVHEASVSIPLNDELRLLAGQIPDWSNYELLPATGNRLITHNLLYDFTWITAYTGVGLELTKGPWVVKGAISNLNTSKNGGQEKSPSFIFRGDYTIDEYSGLGFTGALGKAPNYAQETRDSAFNLFEVDGFYTRGDWNFNGMVTYGQQREAAIALDGDGNKQTAKWWGLSGLAAYKITPLLEGVVRIDYLNNDKNGGGLFGYGADCDNGIGPGCIGKDDLGFWLPNDGSKGANRTALSIGANYRLNEFTVLKGEYRYDRATRDVFYYVDKNEYRNNNSIFGAAVVVSF
jgi:hypothetical protein